MWRMIIVVSVVLLSIMMLRYPSAWPHISFMLFGFPTPFNLQSAPPLSKLRGSSKYRFIISKKKKLLQDADFSSTLRTRLQIKKHENDSLDCEIKENQEEQEQDIASHHHDAAEVGRDKTL